MSTAWCLVCPWGHNRKQGLYGGHMRECAGLLDAGGRNTTVGVRSASGYFRRTAIVGLMLFTQYWCALWSRAW